MPSETLPRLIIQVNRWADEKGIYAKATPADQAKKTIEESVELLESIALDDGNATMELGDILVTAIIGCHMQGIEPEDALQLAYDKISKRDGRMANGQFVRDK